MKFTISVKDTAMSDSIRDEIRDVSKQSLPAGLTEDEIEAILELRVERHAALANKWIEWGEYIDIEFDTDAGTATVVKRKG